MPQKPITMTKSDAKRLLELLAQHNNIIRHASEALKMSETTLTRRVRMAREVLKLGNEPDAQTVRLTSALNSRAKAAAKAVDENTHLSREVDELRKLNVALAESLAHERKAKVAKLVLPKTVARVGGDLIRVIIPDMHGVHADEPAVAACLADVKRLDPDEIVILGDLIDCGGFLAQHHTLGYIEDCNYSYEEDIDAGNSFLDRLQVVAPRARIHYIQGNHEERCQTWCITAALRHAKDADMLRRAIDPAFKLKLAERGISFYHRGVYHQGLRTAGIIRLGKCYFCHGFGHGTHAAADHAKRIGGPVVFGHIHRIQSHGQALVASGEHAAWSVGCLSKFRRRYMHCQPHDWMHGYGLQLVRRDTGTFQHTTVHIIDGQSFLYDLHARVHQGT